MSDHRTLSRLAGLLYLLTFVTSIPALVLKEPFLRAAGAGDPTATLWAVVLEVLLALSCLGTAVVLAPVTRRVSEPLALGFLASRMLEAGAVLIGAVALLALVRIGPSVEQGSLALVATHDAAFLLGPGLLPAVNALLLGTVLYRAKLVPRILPVLGFIGAPLLAASAIATLVGALDQVSPLAGAAALPIALWELGLGVWLTVRGFRPEAVARLSANASAPVATAA